MQTNVLSRPFVVICANMEITNTVKHKYCLKFSALLYIITWQLSLYNLFIYYLLYALEQVWQLMANHLVKKYDLHNWKSLTF